MWRIKRNIWRSGIRHHAEISGRRQQQASANDDIKVKNGGKKTSLSSRQAK